MPRPNRGRTIASERALARRLAYERGRHNMTYEGLASRMTVAGCPIQPSGLYKIEHAGRRITVDELVALSRVLKVDIPDLLEPVERVLHEDIRRAEKAEEAAWEAFSDALDRVVEARRARAELYKRAQSGTDQALGEAVDAYWAERFEAMKAATANPPKRGGLAARLEHLSAERDAALAKMTETERQEYEREQDAARRLEDASFDLFEVVREVADPDGVLGDS